MLKYLFLLLIPTMSTGQMKIFVTKNKDVANVIIYKTKYFMEADLVVKKTWYHEDLTKSYHWYFVSNYTAAKPDWVIFYTKNIHEATHVVYFSDREKLLGNYSACEPIEFIYKKK